MCWGSATILGNFIRNVISHTLDYVHACMCERFNVVLVNSQCLICFDSSVHFAPHSIVYLCNCRVMGIRVALMFRKAKYKTVELDGWSVEEMARKRRDTRSCRPASTRFVSQRSAMNTVLYSRTGSGADAVSIVEVETERTAEVVVQGGRAVGSHDAGVEVYSSSLLSVEVAPIEVASIEAAST